MYSLYGLQIYRLDIKPAIYRFAIYRLAIYRLRNTGFKIHAPKYRFQNIGSKDIG